MSLYLKNYIQNKIHKISQWLLLLIIAYAPWHDALFLGQRPSLSNIPIPILNKMTTAGAANFLWMISISFFLILPHLFDLKWTSLKKKWPEFLLLLWPLLVLFQIRFLNSDALVLTANSLFFSLLFFPFIRPSLYAKEIKFIFKYGFYTLLLSYSLSVMLPFFIPVENYTIWGLFGPVFRYKAWTGEGQPVGFVGFTLCVIAGLRLLYLKKLELYSLLGFIMGFFGVYANILRISLIAVGIFFFVSFIYSLLIKNRGTAFTFIFFFLLSLFSFFTGNFKTKNIISGYSGDKSATSSPSRILDPKNPALKMVIEKKELRHIDAFISTSHRSINYEHLWKKTEGKRFFGLGTGGSSQYLKTVSQYPVLGGDYFRILFDLGFLGLTLFFILGLFLIFYIKSSLFTLMFIALCTILLTDAFLIMPSFGYAPLLLASLGFIRNSALQGFKNKLP